MAAPATRGLFDCGFAAFYRDGVSRRSIARRLASTRCGSRSIVRTGARRPAVEDQLCGQYADIRFSGGGIHQQQRRSTRKAGGCPFDLFQHCSHFARLAPVFLAQFGSFRRYIEPVQQILYVCQVFLHRLSMQKDCSASLEIQADIYYFGPVPYAHRRPPGPNAIGNIKMSAGNFPISPSQLIDPINDVIQRPNLAIVRMP